MLCWCWKMSGREGGDVGGGGRAAEGGSEHVRGVRWRDMFALDNERDGRRET